MGLWYPQEKMKTLGRWPEMLWPLVNFIIYTWQQSIFTTLFPFVLVSRRPLHISPEDEEENGHVCVCVGISSLTFIFISISSGSLMHTMTKNLNWERLNPISWQMVDSIKTVIDLLLRRRNGYKEREIGHWPALTSFLLREDGNLKSINSLNSPFSSIL